MANIQIPITKNGTTTLATAGTYCDRNIDVNVEVGAEPVLTQLDVWENGTYTPQPPYDGFNVVNVGVTAAMETVTITVTDAYNTAAMPMNVIYVNSQGVFGYVTVTIGSSVQLDVLKDSFVAFENVGAMESSWPYNWLFTDKTVWCVSDGQTYTRTA